MRETFDEIGSAGGHHDMAGGQIPLGLLGTSGESEETAVDLVNQSVMGRVFDALSS